MTIIYYNYAFSLLAENMTIRIYQIGLSSDIKSLLPNSVDKKLKIFIFNFSGQLDNIENGDRIKKTFDVYKGLPMYSMKR